MLYISCLCYAMVICGSLSSGFTIRRFSSFYSALLSISRAQWRNGITSKLSFGNLFSSLGLINILDTSVSFSVFTIGDDIQMTLHKCFILTRHFYHVCESFPRGNMEHNFFKKYRQKVWIPLMHKYPRTGI